MDKIDQDPGWNSALLGGSGRSFIKPNRMGRLMTAGIGGLGLLALLSTLPVPGESFNIQFKAGRLPQTTSSVLHPRASARSIMERRKPCPLWAGQDGPLDEEQGGKRRRPQIFNKLSAIFVRLRAFIRSKLMLKVNGRAVLRLTGWHLALAVFVASFLVTAFMGPGNPPVEVAFSEFLKVVQDQGPDTISRLRVSPDRFEYLIHGVPAFTRRVALDPMMTFFFDKNNVPFRAGGGANKSLVAFLLLNILPFAWIFLSMGLGKKFYGDMTGSVGKSADEANIDRSLSFDDVAGIDKAKLEVMELVDMLKSPAKYGKLGARLPKGILLAGPPGTGKTLMARVMAAEAGVPFLYCSGSDFVEMYIGRGAARVRQLFARATKQAPCIIFMDELDTLGKQRSLRVGGSNDEVEQTLNQLLACMDGLDTNKSGVMVIGATNRYEILDDALTRPGRLDRIVRVELPDRTGREAILNVHARKVPLSRDVDLSRMAQITPGLSGADLASLVNEAAIRAVRRASNEVSAMDLEVAVKDFFRSRGTDSEKNWKRLMATLGVAI